MRKYSEGSIDAGGNVATLIIRRALIIVVLGVVVLTSTGCSQGERKKLADALDRSIALADKQVYAGQVSALPWPLL